MLVLRNALETDLDAVFELAKGVGPGMTTLKAERGALRERLAVAAASFSGELAPADADYVFVLEDLAAGAGMRRLGHQGRGRGQGAFL